MNDLSIIIPQKKEKNQMICGDCFRTYHIPFFSVIQHLLGGFYRGNTSIALQKTGYNDKINPAKSKKYVKSTISEDYKYE